MLKVIKSIALVLLVNIPLSYAEGFESLTIMTENFPPYNYKENNELTGKAVELLLKASAAVNKPISAEKDISCLMGERLSHYIIWP